MSPEQIRGTLRLSTRSAPDAADSMVDPAPAAVHAASIPDKVIVEGLAELRGSPHTVFTIVVRPLGDEECGSDYSCYVGMLDEDGQCSVELRVEATVQHLGMHAALLALVSGSYFVPLDTAPFIVLPSEVDVAGV